MFYIKRTELTAHIQNGKHINTGVLIRRKKGDQ